MARLSLVPFGANIDAAGFGLLLCTSFSEGYFASAPLVTQQHWKSATWLSGDYHDRTFTGKLTTTSQGTPAFARCARNAASAAIAHAAVSQEVSRGAPTPNTSGRKAMTSLPTLYRPSPGSPAADAPFARESPATNS